jgi:hypothetical protein
MKEEWKRVIGYSTYYEVSDRGNVRRVVVSNFVKVVRPLQPYKEKIGYLRVDIHKKSWRVHVLVAKEFIANPESLRDINHKDGNKKNNILSNLERVSHRDNIKHAVSLGLHSFSNGELNIRAKLSKSQVLEIRRTYQRNSPQLAKKFGVSKNQIMQIVKRRQWCSV